MRDIGAEAFFLLRDPQPPAPPEPPRRRWRHSVPVRGLALLILGGVLGALPFVLREWSGQGSRSLSLEQAMQIARVPSTQANHLSSLYPRIVSHCKHGFMAIHSLEKQVPLFRQAASTALKRLSSLLNQSKLNRQNRKTPSAIPFAAAVVALNKSPQNSAYTWDSLEVIVYQIEEAALLLQAKQMELSEIGAHAKVMLEILRRHLGM